MYPAFKAVAELQNEKGAVRTTGWALEAEKTHATMYQKAKQAVEKGKDIEVKTIYICKVCGYATEGENRQKNVLFAVYQGKCLKPFNSTPIFLY